MIGILLDQVSNNSECYFLFDNLNKMAQNHDCYLFINDIKELPMQNRFAMLQQIEAMSHRGILIATSIINAQIVANNLTAKKKYFYLWDLEWMKLNNFAAHTLDHIFYNKEMELIVRSVDHAMLVGNLFGRIPYIMYNWNQERLEDIIK